MSTNLTTEWKGKTKHILWKYGGKNFNWNWDIDIIIFRHYKDNIVLKEQGPINSRLHFLQLVTKKEINTAFKMSLNKRHDKAKFLTKDMIGVQLVKNVKPFLETEGPFLC
jgi:hypothetical protein